MSSVPTRALSNSAAMLSAPSASGGAGFPVSRAADLRTVGIPVAVGAFVAYDGFIAYYAPQLVTVEKASNPGVSTIFIGSLMGFLGLVIAVIGLLGSRHPFRIAKQAVSETIQSKAFYKGVIALACIAVYFFFFWATASRMSLPLSFFYPG